MRDNMDLMGETLNFLGWRGQEIDESLRTDIQTGLRECEDLASPKSVWRVFGLKGQALAETGLELAGESMARLLRGATHAALMACTLGHRLDTALRRKSGTDLSRAVLLDAAASALAEAECDRAEGEIRAWAADNGLVALPRFSPGYGDLTLALQPGILGALDAGRRLGLSCTPENLLLPRKSVTAVVGLLPEGMLPETLEKTCKNCEDSRGCPYPSCIKKAVN